MCGGTAAEEGEDVAGAEEACRTERAMAGVNDRGGMRQTMDGRGICVCRLVWSCFNGWDAAMLKGALVLTGAGAAKARLLDTKVRRQVTRGHRAAAMVGSVVLWWSGGGGGGDAAAWKYGSQSTVRGVGGRNARACARTAHACEY